MNLISYNILTYTRIVVFLLVIIPLLTSFIGGFPGIYYRENSDNKVESREILSSKIPL